MIRKLKKIVIKEKKLLKERFDYSTTNEKRIN